MSLLGCQRFCRSHSAPRRAGRAVSPGAAAAAMPRHDSDRTRRDRRGCSPVRARPARATGPETQGRLDDPDSESHLAY